MDLSRFIMLSKVTLDGPLDSFWPGQKDQGLKLPAPSPTSGGGEGMEIELNRIANVRIRPQ